MTNSTQPLDSDTDTGPVTTIVRWNIRPDRKQEFEAWQAGIAAEAMKFAGHLGIDILRPADPTQGDYVVIFRFDSYTHLQAWEDSSVRRDWVRRVEAFQQEAPTIQKVTGLETWFTLPDVTTLPPPRWKMVIVTSLALYPLINIMRLFWQPLFANVSPWLSGLVTLPISMLLMTYLIMPQMTRLFSRWLFPSHHK